MCAAFRATGAALHHSFTQHLLDTATSASTLDRHALDRSCGHQLLHASPDQNMASFASSSLPPSDDLVSTEYVETCNPNGCDHPLRT